MDREAVKKEFAAKLRNLMLNKGWNQSELARRSQMGRDNISCYLRGRTLPEAPQLNKLAKALAVDPDELIAGIATRVDTGSELPFEMREVEGGGYYVRVGTTVTFDQAVEIMQILKEKENRPGKKK